MTIDWWTLGLQLVNVLILVWLLGRFFWKPLAGMIAQRRTTAMALLAEATAKRDEAATALAGIAASRAGFAQERDAILAEAHATAEQTRTALLAQATEQAAAMTDAAKADIAKAKAAAGAEWEQRSGELAVDIAQRLAARLDGHAVRAAFLDWLLQSVRALPDTARQNAGGLALEAVSATPLDAAEQESVRSHLAEAFGTPPRITFAVDASLIAGLELHGPHFTVGNSWSADLTRIRGELSHDARR